VPKGTGIFHGKTSAPRFLQINPPTHPRAESISALFISYFRDLCRLLVPDSSGWLQYLILPWRFHPQFFRNLSVERPSRDDTCIILSFTNSKCPIFHRLLASLPRTLLWLRSRMHTTRSPSGGRCSTCLTPAPWITSRGRSKRMFSCPTSCSQAFAQTWPRSSVWLLCSVSLTRSPWVLLATFPHMPSPPCMVAPR